MFLKSYERISQAKNSISGSKKATVKDVNIWLKNEKMVISLDLQGAVDGTIYLAGS
jgi:hypothetical protein